MNRNHIPRSVSPGCLRGYLEPPKLPADQRPTAALRCKPGWQSPLDLPTCEHVRITLVAWPARRERQSDNAVPAAGRCRTAASGGPPVGKLPNGPTITVAILRLTCTSTKVPVSYVNSEPRPTFNIVVFDDQSIDHYAHSRGHDGTAQASSYLFPVFVCLPTLI